jgi:hypothetical protein
MRHDGIGAGRAAAVASIVLTIAACGGGGGGGGGGSTGTSSPGTGGTGGGIDGTFSDQLEYFFAPGSLQAVAPSAPTQAIEVDDETVTDNGDVAPRPVFAGTWNASEGRAQSLGINSVVYVRNDGTLQRVSADASAGTPAPQRISSASDASPGCLGPIATDLDDADNARLTYASRPQGASCSDKQQLSWKQVAVGAGSGTAPQDLPGEPVAAFFDPADGSHGGWLVEQLGTPNQLVRIAADGTNEGEIANSDYASFADSMEVLADGRGLLNLDGDLHLFDPGTNTLEDLGHQFAQLSGTGERKVLRFDTDGEEMYWVDNDFALYRTDVADGTGDGVTVVALDEPADAATASFGITSALLAIGTSNVAWSYQRDPDPNLPGDEEIAIRTVSKSATGSADATDLKTLSFGTSVAVPVPVQNASGWLFYNTIGFSGQTAYAQKIDDDTAEVEIDNAQWIGAATDGTARSGLRGTPLERMIYVGDLTSLSSASYGGKPLRSVDAANPDPGSTGLDLGTIPSDVQGVVPLLGFGPSRIASASADNGAGGTQLDILQFDAAQAGSLSRATRTQGTDETAIPFF